MTVVMGVRNPKNARISVEKEIDVSQMKGKIYYEELDTGSMESVKKFAAAVKERFSAIDILVNNGKYNCYIFTIMTHTFYGFYLCHVYLGF